MEIARALSIEGKLVLKENKLGITWHDNNRIILDLIIFEIKKHLNIYTNPIIVNIKNSLKISAFTTSKTFLYLFISRLLLRTQ